MSNLKSDPVQGPLHADACCTVPDKKTKTPTHPSNVALFIPAGLSLLLFSTALILDYSKPQFFTDVVRACWYAAAYWPVGWPVWKNAIKALRKGEVFTEFLLMALATLGAFALGQFPEGVAVMLFYSVGEIFQSLAVARARANIKSLLDQRPDEVTVVDRNQPARCKAESVVVGSILELKHGERLALDGELISDTAFFNTAALTGESKPDKKIKGEPVLAGMINLNTVTRVKVTTPYQDSKLARILKLIQQAANQKAKPELFIRKFARYYTPAVALVALAITIVPYFVLSEYFFNDWLYRALIFLVISCPCALVISIPLGYFGGIGAASRNGILFKGGNFLDVIAHVRHVVLDKTGTLTHGVFDVQTTRIKPGFDATELLAWVNALESKSTHPIATAIHRYAGTVNPNIHFQAVEEIPGRGLRGLINEKELLVGSFSLLDKFEIQYGEAPVTDSATAVAVAYDKEFAGYLIIADKVKVDAAMTIQELRRMNITATVLSGDQQVVVKQVANQVGIADAYGNLLPENKVTKLKEIRARMAPIAFVGDGVNDAPVLALSDVGVAMGGLGSDAAIETADVVIQDDRLSKIPIAIRIGKKTRQLVWQNIFFAFSVKALVMLLGAGGLATLWEAVFADVGVALLAIVNAVRIQYMPFRE